MIATLELRRNCARGGSASHRPLFGFLAGVALACGVLRAVPAAAQTVPVAGAQVHTKYEASTTFSAVHDLLAEHKVLEKAQVFLSPLRLPREITLRTAECGASSVPYDAQKGIITICYEAVADIQALAKGSSTDPNDLASLVTGGVVEEVLHRMALAILQVFDIPVWGRQEDAADMLGAFLMMQFDERTANVVLLGAAQLFVYKTSALGKVDYASDVSPPAQRFYNFLCIAVGNDLLDFGGLVEKGLLPKERAQGCRDEYEKVRRAFDMRVMPHVDADLVVKVRATDWLHEDKN